MDEPSCEFSDTCTTDMLSFKGYLHRWYATVTQIAPFTADRILPVLQTSTSAAVKQCTGGRDGRQCGFKWSSGQYADPPGTGAGQQMNVLGAVSSLLIGQAPSPVTDSTGGTSKGDPNAGGGANEPFEPSYRPITTADRAGAGILTVLVLGSACGLFGWMSVGG
jgi:mannan endo-1,6-alpha-mannosidase